MQSKIEFTISLDSYNTELPDAVSGNLLQQAQAVLQNAYAPYSQFHVAAAILLSNGEIITGTNQENAAYPSGLCAERVAVFTAKSLFPNVEIIAVAITTSIQSDLPVAPCGACRQVLIEYELNQSHPIKIIFGVAQKQVIVSNSVKNLLPLPFQLHVK